MRIGLLCSNRACAAGSGWLTPAFIPSKKRRELRINVIIVRRARRFVLKGEFGQIQIVRQRDCLLRDIDRLDFGRLQPRRARPT